MDKDKQANSVSSASHVHPGGLDPFVRLMRQVAETGDFSLRFPEDEGLVSGDLAQLGRALNSLLARVQVQQADQVADGLEFSGSQVSQLAHEFNNVIQVVMGFSELALRHLESGHEARPLIEEVLKTSSDASGFTRRFLRQGESAED